MTTELALRNAPLRDRLEYAQALATAGLLPDSFKRQPANVLVAMEVATALDMAPITVINELAVIGGKPTFSAKFMRALIRRAGHKLRERYADGAATCVIIRADDPDFEHTTTWDEAKARQHDYWGKGHWKKNPELMLKNRALSECVREACPEVLAGVSYTPDEVEDFAPAAGAEHRVEQTPASAAPPEGEAESGAVTKRQLADIGSLMKSAGKSKADMLRLASECAGRPIAGAGELTADEADALIGLLGAVEVLDAEVVDESTGEVSTAVSEGEAAA